MHIDREHVYNCVNCKIKNKINWHLGHSKKNSFCCILKIPILILIQFHSTKSWKQLCVQCCMPLYIYQFLKHKFLFFTLLWLESILQDLRLPSHSRGPSRFLTYKCVWGVSKQIFILMFLFLSFFCKCYQDYLHY